MADTDQANGTEQPGGLAPFQVIGWMIGSLQPVGGQNG